jgi:hypothetical protein
MNTTAAPSKISPVDNTGETTFRAFLLRRWERKRTTRWIKRSAADDVAREFAQDCQEYPNRVPHGDAELYEYLKRQVGHIELKNQITGRVRMNCVELAGSVLDYLWSQYLRTKVRS